MYNRYEKPVNSLEDLIRRDDIIPSVRPNDPNHLMFLVSFFIFFIKEKDRENNQAKFLVIHTELILS